MVDFVHVRIPATKFSSKIKTILSEKMVWPNYQGQGGDQRNPRDNPEFLRQMAELRRREQDALHRQVGHY